jgi:glycyl-tRNA synthetase beta chain
LPLDLIIEIGCEEIPARHVNASLEQLERLFAHKLSEHRLSFIQLQTFATPRRLIVAVNQLIDRQPDRTEVILGPPASVAFTSEKTPTRAAEGFAKKHDLSLTDLKCVETEKGQYLGFDKTARGEASSEILPEVILSIIAGLEFPKRMKWEQSQFLFVRPIRWILCLLGGDILPVSLAGVDASRRTFGHRILSHNAVIEVSNFDDYRNKLINLKVEIDPASRYNLISSFLEQAATQNEGNLVCDEVLLKSVVHLNEWPSVICGTFDPSFLRLPREVLVTVLREHQKYFSIEDKQGQLLPKFLAVVDADPAHHALVALGHERVLKARLADASFFWDTDLRVTLEDRVDKLKKIVFQENLGTLHDKIRRVGTLAEFFAKSTKRSDLLPDVAQAVRLCKIDLTTEMVKEFTDLQGVMGGLYAGAQHLPQTVAEAIYDHYRPMTLEDNSPRNSVGAILSFSDKLDSVVAAFSIGLAPTGSRDPLALRRQTLGLIKALLDHKLSVSLKKMSLRAYANLKRQRLAKRSFEETHLEFEKFFKDRLKFVFKEQGFRYDEINAIVDVDADNALDCLERLSALAAMRDSPDFYSLAVSFKRIKNIILKAGLDIRGPFSVDVAGFQMDEERALHAKIQTTLPVITRARRKRAYHRTFELMASLRPQVDLFFDKVLVMAEDPAVQANRLGLLGTLLVIFRNMADISEIVVS